MDKGYTIDLNNFLKNEGLNFLIENNLFKSFIKSILVAKMISHIELDDELKTKAFQNFMLSNKIKNEQDLKKFLEISYISQSELEKDVIKQAKIIEFAKRKYNKKANTRFLARRRDLEMVVYSLIRTSNQELAKEIYFKVESEEEGFEELAIKYSEGNEKYSRGIIGPVPINQGHPSLADKLRVMQKGELSEPFLLDNWWCVLRLEKLIKPSFNEIVESQMCKEIFDEEINSLVNSFIQKNSNKNSALKKMTIIKKELVSIIPVELNEASLNLLLDNIKILKFKVGQEIVEKSTIQAKVFIIKTGYARLLGEFNNKLKSVHKFGKGSLLGHSSIINDAPMEYITAAEDLLAYSVYQKIFEKIYAEDNNFRSYVNKTIFPQEIFFILNNLFKKTPKTDFDFKEILNDANKSFKKIPTKEIKNISKESFDRSYFYSIEDVSLGN